jgi:hypothetical protein
MKKFVIVRHFPGAGNLTQEEINGITQASLKAMYGLNKPYAWFQSFVTDDKIYCIHGAENADVIREHAKCGNFPINTVEEVKHVFDPVTGG